jgi:glycosyltransferase involved in cell wall biosynthesis
MNNLIVCIPSYNRAVLLFSLFENLRNQKDQNFILIILNDGDNKETRDLLKDQSSEFKYHYIETKKPSGLPLARNTILDYIESEKLATEKTFIAFLDDDLEIKEDFTEKIKEYSSKFDAFCFRMEQKGIAPTFDLAKYKFLQKIFSPIIGKIIPFLGIIFGGFYIKTQKIKKVDHLVGCCLIYDFSKNMSRRFDLNLNEGNYIGEDTCFSYGLKKAGNDLRFIGTYSFIHNSPSHGGCKINNKRKSFFWYWKHKLYIFRIYNSKIELISAKFFCFLESIFLSFVFRYNLVKEYFESIKHPI